MFICVLHSYNVFCCKHISGNETFCRVFLNRKIKSVLRNVGSLSKRHKASVRISKKYFSLHLVQKKRHLYPLVLCLRYYNINRQFIFSVQNRQFQCYWKTNKLHHFPVGSRGLNRVLHSQFGATHCAALTKGSQFLQTSNKADLESMSCPPHPLVKIRLIS